LFQSCAVINLNDVRGKEGSLVPKEAVKLMCVDKIWCQQFQSGLECVL